MSEYLSKEEIRQWRSSLEKITLEEFAARLGKTINEEKETRDIVDIVLEKEPVLVHDNYKIKTEKITTIAQRALSKEREITTVKHNLPLEPVKVEKKVKPVEKKEAKAVNKKVKSEKPKKAPKAEPIEVKIEPSISGTNVNVTFKKPLTGREQLVFDHFLSHKNSIV